MVRPIDNGRAGRFTMDGTAMASDEADAALVAYEKGRADQAAVDDATEVREERIWRFVFAGLLAVIAAVLAVAVRTQHDDSDSILRAIARTTGK